MQGILQADQRQKQNHKDAILPAHPQELYPSGGEPGPILNHKNIRPPIIQCRRHWSIFFVMEVWRIKDYLQDHFCVLSSLVWRKVEEQHRRRRRTQEKISVLCWFFRNNSVPPSSSKSFRTQSHWSYFTRQCHYTRRFPQVHWSMSDVQSIYIPSSIRDWYPGGQILSNRQTVFFLPVDPMNKEHKDPDTIDLGVPRLAQYMHKAWKKHQNNVYWVDINLAQKKDWSSLRHATILHETLPAYCIPKVVRMETGEVIYEKVFASPRPRPKISLKHDRMKELGSEVARQPEGEVARQAEGFQPTQPNPNPIMVARWNPLFAENTSHSSNQEIDARFSRDSKNSNLEATCKSR